MATIRRDGETVEVLYDYMDVTPRSEPNPDWSYTDENGHTHNAKSGTYAPVVYAEATDEYPSVWRYECKECSAHIPSGVMERSVKFRQYVRI